MDTGQVPLQELPEVWLLDLMINSALVFKSRLLPGESTTGGGSFLGLRMLRCVCVWFPSLLEATQLLIEIFPKSVVRVPSQTQRCLFLF